jgi:hypothetical protein
MGAKRWQLLNEKHPCIIVANYDALLKQFKTFAAYLLKITSLVCHTNTQHLQFRQNLNNPQEAQP